MRIITQTPRLTIREFIPDELEAYLNHFNDEELCFYIPKRTREERVNIFHKAIANYTNGEKLLIYGMYLKPGNEFIGSCLIRPFGDEPKTTELGYSINRIHWGKGLATEMAEAMIAIAFEDQEIKQVVAVTVPANTASGRVLEKAGFKQMENLIRGEEELAYFKLERNNQ
jgi:ribosomal-protein-alanine N-acetyltransferase